MADRVRAWRPDVPHLREVLHAEFTEHAYPSHTHGDWAVLLIDDGAVAYDLDRHPHTAEPTTVTLLPPHVPHDGRTARAGRPFRKRVLYLDESWLPPDTIGHSVDQPTVARPDVGAAVRHVHGALVGGDAFEAESELVRIHDLLREHLHGPTPPAATDAPLARRLRELLDAAVADGVTLEEASRVLGAHPSHLVRSFSRAYGMPPHRYLTSRRVDLARRLVLDGLAVADAAVAAGFHDQAHLTRHFRAVLGATPGAFARSARS
ncbi:AraC family transcriptional regulator [Mumia zhuanghuii]|uniref:AraC family transcriptional regulator n=2 Tax=Mumia TaxID=1546255 RepID=A0ABW1QRE0_9ACTN|nr:MULTISPECIES: AraC family transcriptional regulator [Mumia]KAA1423864.1 AraC family transcriptional regulator [Mumia zhuanghuii]